LVSLYDFLLEKLQGVKRLSILGAGSFMRADDAAGVMITENLSSFYGDEKCKNIQLCTGETAPENFSGKIKKFSPTHLLIIDAADLGLEPGSIAEINPCKIGGPSYCSHMLPLKIMIDYLEKETNASVTLIGIQFKNINFDQPMTAEIQETVDELCNVLKAIIDELI